jgi:hypothetical protein
MCQHQRLPSTFETAFGPLNTEDVSGQKIRLAADLAPVHTARTPQQLLAEFWTPADSPPYLPDLNLLDFSIWSVLKAKGEATTHNNLTTKRLSIAVEWDRLAVEYIRKNCCSFRHRQQAATKKNEV